MGLNRLGRIIKATGAMQCYRDGDTIGFIWRWWHPLSWLIAPLLFVLYGLTSGFPEAWHRRHDVGLRISPYFRKHPERLEWL